MPNFTIRNAQPTDADKLADFNVEMARETEDKPLDRVTVRSGVCGVLNDDKNGFYIVAADENDDIIGGLLMTFEWSDWRDGVIWWIQSVYVVPQWRGRGIYRALYTDVKARAAAAGNVCGMRLYVERDNVTAQAAYEKLGMHQAHYLIYEEML